MIRVKICGITNYEDALKAVELGASALGFVFAPSPRAVDPAVAGKIIARLPPWIATVAVFVNEKPVKIMQVMAQGNIDWVQLHGEELPEECEQLNLKIIKTVKDNINIIPEYKVAGILLDAYDPARAGGTGKLYDWNKAKEAKKYGKPIILAGGLTPDNVKEAIAVVRPYGVEASSGVEKEPGKKDYKKMEMFIKTARSA